VSLDPAPVLAVLVGIFHTSLFVLIRGSAGGQLPLLLAGAGDALGDRMGIGLLAIGEFQLLAASIFSWLGIGFVAIVAILGPTRRRA
jgi:hypothetical protein